jgi:hypothetical protein
MKETTVGYKKLKSIYTKKVLGYALTLNGYLETDWHMSYKLGMNYEKYTELLTSCGAVKRADDGELYFPDEDHVQAAIIALKLIKKE